MRWRIASIIMLCLFLSASESHALLRVAVVGAVTKPTKIAPGPVDLVPNDLSYGGGVLVTLLSLRFGAIYKIQKVQNTQVASNIWFNSVYERREIEVPVLWHKSFLRIFSLGLGGYYSKGLAASGSFTTNRSQTPRPAGADDLKKTDYGAKASFGFGIPFGVVTRLLINGCYNYGFAKIKTREAQGLVGLEFGI